MGGPINLISINEICGETILLNRILKSFLDNILHSEIHEFSFTALIDHIAQLSTKLTESAIT